jgi:TolB-like protein
MRYAFGNFELDASRRVLRLDAAAQHVEPQVFDLILYLIENRTRVVDKEELIARVWKGRIVSDAAISSRMNAARKAVGDDGRKQQVIRTKSRQGFQFIANVNEFGGALGQPAIAVLPFDYLSENPDLRHLARGLADELARTLGQAAWFDVRDTAASFAVPPDDVTPSEISERLNVNYLVAGSIQAARDEIKVALRVIDAKEDRQVWSKTFPGPIAEIFSLQDDIANQILGQIEPRLRQVEFQRSSQRHGNLTAFDHYLRASDLVRSMDVPSLEAACSELDLAVGEHPAYGAAHGMRAWIATLLLPLGRRVDAKSESTRSRRALTDGAFDSEALSMAGYALGFFDRDPEAALPYLWRALAINPSSCRGHDHVGWLLLYAGRSEEAYVHFDRALELSPIDEFSFRMLTGRAFAQMYQLDFQGAVLDARRAHAAAPTYTVCHRVLAASLAHLGHGTEARKAVQALLSHNHGLTVAKYRRETRFQNPDDRDLLFSGLKMAGLP